MTHLRAVKIGARLGIGFGIILLMVICVLVADILISANARDTQNRGLRHANAKAVQAGLMRSAVLEGGIAARNVGLQYTTPTMLKEEEKFQQQRTKFLEAQRKLTDLGLTDAEKAIVATIVSLNAQTDAPLKEAMELVKSYSNEAAGKLISSRIDPLNKQAIAEIDKLVNLQQAAIDDLLESADAAGRRLTMLLIGMGVLTVLMGGMFSWMTTRSITRPLQDAVGVAKRVAGGKLGAPIEVSGKDETSELLRALKEMDDSLSRIVSQVRSGTDEIGAASDEISAGNADLSGRTEAQASALEESPPTG